MVESQWSKKNKILEKHSKKRQMSFIEQIQNAITRIYILDYFRDLQIVPRNLESKFHLYLSIHKSKWTPFYPSYFVQKM